MKKFFWSAFAAGLTIGILLIFWHPKTTEQAVAPKVPVKNVQACSKDPCIEITQIDGQKFQLNDFSFAPNHCILFITVPAGEHKQTCGDYKLQWIGPDNMDQKHNTPITI